MSTNGNLNNNKTQTTFPPTGSEAPASFNLRLDYRNVRGIQVTVRGGSPAHVFDQIDELLDEADKRGATGAGSRGRIAAQGAVPRRKERKARKANGVVPKNGNGSGICSPTQLLAAVNARVEVPYGNMGDLYGVLGGWPDWGDQTEVEGAVERAAGVGRVEAAGVGRVEGEG